MPDYSAGEARLSVVPDASGFRKRLEAELKKIDSEFAIRVSADTAQARADIDRFREQQQRNGMRISVDAVVAKAEGELERFRKSESSKTVKPPVDPQLSRAEVELARFRKTQELRAIRMKIEFDEASAIDKLRILQKQMEGVGTAGDAASAIFSGGFLNPGVLVAAAGLLPGLSSGVGQVAAALQQLAQAGLLVPGIIASVGASIGTFKLGIDGVGDAFDAVNKASSGSAKDIEAANKALAGLAPNARNFVTVVSSLKPKFDELKSVVQNDLFAGLGDQVKALVDKDFPSLERGLDGIAKGLNQNLSQALTSLGSDDSKGILDRILGNTGQAQSRISDAIDPLIKGLGTLAAAGTDFLPKLADDISGLTQRFSAFIESADKDGRLAAWIHEGITGVEHLGSAIGHVADAFTTITHAAGGEFLANLDSVTQKFANWLNSSDGQQKLLDFLNQGKQQLSNLTDLVKNVGPAFQQGFSDSANAMGATLTTLKDITGAVKWLMDNVPGLSKAFEGVLNPIKTVTDLFGVQSPQRQAQDKLNSARANAPTLPAFAPAPNVAPGAAVQPATPNGSYAPPSSSNPFALPGHASGGPTLSRRNGPTGGYIAELHPNEWVLPAHARKAVGDDALWALTKGRSFDGGGHVDENGNPITGNFNPGMKIDTSLVGTSSAWDGLMGDQMLGHPSWRTDSPFLPPTVSRKYTPKDYDAYLHMTYGSLAQQHGLPGFDIGGHLDENGNPVTANTTGPIAPNPTAGGGGMLNSIIDNITSGLSGPVGNLAALGQGVMNVGGGSGIGHGASGGIGSGASGGTNSLADRFASVPGPFGLLGSMGSSDPKKNLMGWGQQTGQWLGNFTAKTVGGFGSALWQGGLDFFGLGNSILSPNNSWNQAGQSLGDFAFGADGPLGKLLGANNGDGLDSSSIPTGSDRPGTSVSSSPSISSVGRGLVVGAKGGGASQWRPLVAQIVASRGLGPEWVDPLLRQIQTESGGNPASVNANDSNGRGGTQRVEGLFNFLPSTFTGNGGRNIWDPADQINTAITYVLGRYGQTNGAPNWIGAPGRGFTDGGSVWGAGTATSDSIPAMLSNGEHVLTADDVHAMGGQQNVMTFRQALHRGAGGEIGGPAGDGGGADTGKGGWFGTPHTKVWGKWENGIMRGPKWAPRGPGRGFRDRDWPWWFFPGKEPSIGDPSPSRDHRRDVIIGPDTKGPTDHRLPPGAYAPPSDIRTPQPNGPEGSWKGPNNDFPKPGDSRGIWWGNRRGVSGFAAGGPIPDALVPTPPTPPPMPTTTAHMMTPPAPPASVAPQHPSAPAASGAATGSIGSAATQAPSQQPFYGGNANVAPAPTNLNHNLPAISKGIASTASVLGNLASQAIGAGMAGAGMPGGGMAGQFAAGLIKEGGKVVDAAVNVGSSFLVGSVPGSTGTQDRAFGQTVFPQQNVPVTAPSRGGSTINAYGISDVDRLMQAVELRDAQSRAGLAHYGG